MSDAGGRRDWKPSHNPWLVAIVVTIGAFMEVLDTTIVNVSLPHIAGDLAVSYDQATWALTSYLLANGIVLTISGWLSDVIGRKRYLLLCIAGFTIASFLCGISTSLGEIIIFRLMQGFCGGGLQPTQQSIMLDVFPPAQRSKAFAITAIATVVAPVLGPTLGGYITDVISWRWVFFINVPVGIGAFFAVQAFVEDPPWAKARSASIDYIGLSLITLGLGCLEVMIDRGEDDDWFGSNFIIGMGILAAIGIAGAICWLIYAEKPVVDLRVFKDRNFALCSIMMAAMAIILYASAVIIPQLAQQRLGYTAYLAGLILSPGGIVIIILIPVVGQISKRIPTKYVIGMGFMIMGFAMLYSANLAPNIDYMTLVYMRAAQTAGLAFLFVPLTTVAFTTLPQSMNGDGSALFTMFRNFFGSLAISFATAMVTQRSQARQSYLVDNLTPLNRGYSYTLSQVEQSFQALGHPAATTAASAQNWIYQQLQGQSAVLAYIDVFTYTAIGAFCVAPLCLLLSSKSGGGDGPPAH